MSTQDAIVKFKKSSSLEDRQKIVADLKAQGCEVKKDDKIDSSLFPFVVVAAKPDSFKGLQSKFKADHPVVDNIEADGQVHTC